MSRKSVLAVCIFMIVLLFLLIGCSDSDQNSAVIGLELENSGSANAVSKTDFPPVAPEQLSFEDGTGVLFIGMHRDDVIAQFDAWDLNYEVSCEPEISDFSLITVNYGSYSYRFDREGFLESIQFDITAKGLRYGDTVARMIEIYGTDYSYAAYSTESGGVLCYYTYSFSDSTVFTVEAYGDGDDGLVMRRMVGRNDINK